MSDAGVNNQRLVFGGERGDAPGITQKSAGFNRSPYLSSLSLTGTPLIVQLLTSTSWVGQREGRHRAARARNLGRGEVDGAPEQFQLRRGARAQRLGRLQQPKTRKDGTNIVYRALTGGGLVTPEHPG